MSWALPHVAELEAGRTVQFRPRGHSMRPKIKSGQLVTVEPMGNHVVQKGDIVLCKVRGRYFLHLVKALDAEGERYQIGNNRGHVNGWVRRRGIYGVCTKVGG